MFLANIQQMVTRAIVVTIMATACTVVAMEALYAEMASAPQPVHLRQVLEMAIERNETADIARSRLTQAQALRRQAVGRLLPQLSASASILLRPEISGGVGDTQTVVRSGQRQILGAEAELLVFDPSSMSAIRASRHGVDASEFESGELVRQMVFETAIAYVQAYEAHRLLESALKQLDVARQEFARAKVRLETGTISKVDAGRIELQQAQSKLDVTRARTQVVVADNVLRVLLDAQAPIALTEPSALLTQLPAKADYDVALHPRVQALSMRVDQAQTRANAPLYRWIPSLGIVGSYSLSDQSDFSGQAQDWSVRASARWSLFDGGTKIAERRQMQAAYEEQLAQLTQQKRSMKADVQNALIRLEGAQSALAQSKVQLRLASEQLQTVRVQFGAGSASSVELADALSQYSDADAAAVQARLQVRLAEIEVLNVTGRLPYDLDVMQPRTEAQVNQNVEGK